MKKLIVLKSLVDIIWIVTCIPALLIIPVFLVMMFIDPDVLSITNIAVEELSVTESHYAKFYVFLMSAIVYVGIYCFYVFRKTLRYFQRVKPFHVDVIQNFYKIGRLLSAIGIVGSLGTFIGRLVLENHLKLNLGFSPYLTILCLGLFFMVLSELFKVAKVAKEENELTI